MAGEALVLDRPEAFQLLSTDFETICELPLEAGGTYFVVAKGDISVIAGEIELRLETFNAADDTKITHSHGGPQPFVAAHSSFALMFATRLPAEPEPGAGPFTAVLRGRRDPRGGGAEVASIMVVALTLDRVSFVTG